MDWDNLRIFLSLARSDSLAAAARKLEIDQTTVARRLRRFEEEVGTQLFARNNQGHALTEHGQRLVEHAEAVEARMEMAAEELGGQNRTLAGPVRLGVTEGLGTVLMAPQLSYFAQRHPKITVDVLTVPRFVSLSRREADIAIVIERPQSGNYIHTKLADYRLKLYASRTYLATHPRIKSIADLGAHRFITYLEDLAISDELRYMKNIAPDAQRSQRCSNVVAQYFAALHGFSLAILPCFVAQQSSELVPVLEKEVNLLRTFWLVASPETRHTARAAALWDFCKEVMAANSRYMMGESRDISWCA